MVVDWILRNLLISGIWVSPDKEIIKTYIKRKANLKKDDDCKPAINVYYLKIPKTGSTTLSSILNRHALEYNLTVATFIAPPIRKSRVITALYPRHHMNPSRKYNMVTVHSKFTLENLTKILHTENLQFITILRSPMSHLTSYIHFNEWVRKSLNLVGLEPVRDFLMRTALKHKACYRVRNLQAQWFGIPNNLGVNSHEFHQRVENISKVFFIGLTEYFDETLVLIGRKLCWKDHKIFTSIALRKQKHPNYENDEKMRRLLCHWSPQDCYLYRYFRKKLLKLLKNQGSEFIYEVLHIKKMNRKVASYCEPVIRDIEHSDWETVSVNFKHYGKLDFPKSRWSPRFEIKPFDCALMHQESFKFNTFFRLIQNNEECGFSNVSMKKILGEVKPEELCRPGDSKVDIINNMLKFKAGYVFT